MKIKKHIFFLQPLKISTWSLHYWNEEKILHPFSLHVILMNLLFFMQNVKFLCGELFDGLPYMMIENVYDEDGYQLVDLLVGSWFKGVWGPTRQFGVNNACRWQCNEVKL